MLSISIKTLPSFSSGECTPIAIVIFGFFVAVVALALFSCLNCIANAVGCMNIKKRINTQNFDDYEE